jgi:hypothetical protein
MGSASLLIFGFTAEGKSISELDARALRGRRDSRGKCATSATQMSRW